MNIFSAAVPFAARLSFKIVYQFNATPKISPLKQIAQMTLERFVSSCELWLRLAMFILGPLRDALLNVLYINGVPKQPKDLYKFLISKKTLLAQLKGRGVITKPQWEILYPQGKTETDSNLFDITLILVLIKELTTIKPNDGNWRQDDPPGNDKSVGAFCIRARQMRNYLIHFPRITALKEAEFSTTWDELLVAPRRRDNLLLRAIILYNQTKLNHHDTQIHELTNKNLSLENQTNNIIKKLERMRCKLWSNSNDIEDIQEELEQAHNSITQMQEDIACLKDDVKGLKVRVEKLESWPNFLTALQKLYQQYYPISVISIAIIGIAVSTCYFSSALTYCNSVTYRTRMYDIGRGFKANLKDPLHFLLGDDKNLKEASDLLRQYYLEGIGKEHIESINGQTISRKRFYVDLAVVDSLDVDINNTHSAREFHIKQMLSQKGKCTMENLLDEENQIVLLRGIGGIGKSFMVKTMALNWAENRIWTNFRFVFLFKFREMNVVRNISSLSDLVLRKYPLLFTKIKFTDLVPASKKIIFIMDGLDEFTRVEDLHIISKQESDNVSDISKVIFETINPHNALMPGHKTVITSRPNACPVLRKSFSTASIKQVDILGFSSEQVLDYINVFSGSDTKLGNLLRKKIYESKQLKLLSRIPVFLWTICSLYQEQRLLHAPKTTTELFVWQLTLFLHRHYKTRPSNQLTSNVFDIFKEKCVQKVVFSLSFLAQKMLADGVILIDVAGIPKEIRNENIEATGLVSKLQTMDGLKYQFNHLLMQEFLTAVYYFFPEGKHKNDITSNPSLSGCLPLVCGLHGALKVKSESSSILKQFVKNMGLVQHGINPLNNLLRTKNPQLLQGIFEYQNNLSEKIIQQCKLTSGCSDLFLTVDASHTQSELVYFLEKYRNDFDVLGITFKQNQGGVSCVVGLSKIMSDICSVSSLIIYSNSFDQGSLKYFITSLHYCSKNSVYTSKWYSIIFVYWGEDFDRDYGEVTRALFDTLLLYKQVHLHVPSHSRRVIYDLRKSIMQNKYEMRLEKLHLDIRAIKPYFCEMLAEILLRVKDVEVQKTRSAFYRFSDEEVDCLKQALDKLLKET
ncbi:uncharacterized protein LOC130629228 [Hydractinia symbiolongicarpus]|uniref:uncharacterized protein LOC130629228 n=1 Tax=Hydractinia symbiolongicarpus TaxID=13093 RepID=UPI00254DC9E6|nr:uncharacterized protein LOC130629228 [Hydractinia symbiolongicarpus]